MTDADLRAWDDRFRAWVSTQMRDPRVHAARNRMAVGSDLTEPGLRLASIAEVRPRQATAEGEAFMAAVCAAVER